MTLNLLEITFRCNCEDKLNFHKNKSTLMEVLRYGDFSVYVTLTTKKNVKSDKTARFHAIYYFENRPGAMFSNQRNDKRALQTPRWEYVRRVY